VCADVAAAYAGDGGGYAAVVSALWLGVALAELEDVGDCARSLAVFADAVGDVATRRAMGRAGVVDDREATGRGGGVVALGGGGGGEALG
jgi:hypothetical protein